MRYKGEEPGALTEFFSDNMILFLDGDCMALLRRFSFTLSLLVFLSFLLQAQPYFVSTVGDDAIGTGTIDLPYKTIAKAVSVALAGDTIYMRGGTYSLSTSISISKSGTSSARYNLIAYPGDIVRPLLDCSTQAFGSRGISLIGSYWYIKGIDVVQAGDNGLYIGGSNNIIEFCTFSENRDSGLQLSGGASNNQIINCDSFFNADPTDYGDADGFACKMDVGSGNYFYGCRSWLNCDDGWDGYMRGATGVTTTLENCWTWRNGYFKNGTDAGAAANGNGFKMGGSDTKNLVHNFIVKNCLSFHNKAKGFDQNSNAGSITLYNCTAYMNTGKDYMLNSSGVTYDVSSVFTVINCLALGTSGTSFRASTILTTNNFSTTASDYVSVDTTGISGPRKVDGSLPDITFMHLKQGSPCIDAGINVGLPFNGLAPDLGFFESDYSTDVHEEIASKISGFQLLQNYPNPFNPSTVIRFSVAKEGAAKLHVINILGQQVATLFSEHAEPGKIYHIQFNTASLPSGVYLSILESNGKQEVKKMVLLK
jgi:hypothetical protein